MGRVTGEGKCEGVQLSSRRGEVGTQGWGDDSFYPTLTLPISHVSFSPLFPLFNIPYFSHSFTSLFSPFNDNFVLNNKND